MNPDSLRLLRTKLFLLFAGVFLLAGKSQGEFRVATYNLRNYLLMDRLVEGDFRLDYPKPESEKTVVRQSILSVSPDLLVVQEIGDLRMLAELRDDLALEGLNYSGMFALDADDDTRKVGALWKSGLEVKTRGHTDLDFKLFDSRYLVKRGMLELLVKHEQIGELNVFVLHLKSKYTSDSRDPQSELRRTREAEAARNRILELHPDPQSSRLLVLGDLNDYRNSGAVRRFLQKGDLTLSEIVEARDSHGLLWTHYYQKGGTYALIDYMLASPGLMQSAKVSGQILNNKDYYTGSDHRLVWADLELVQD